MSPLGTSAAESMPIVDGVVDINNNTIEATTSNDTVSDGIKIGPDLNKTRSPLDKKLYRHITLPNGLQAVVVQDTIAMHQHKQHGVSMMDEYESDDDDDESDEDENNNDDDEDGDGDKENDVEEAGGLRDSACAILVGGGSVSDPNTCPGLAHFLEHLLFMGSKKYPIENEYESYVSKHGGFDNAFTEWEYTCYSLEIPAQALWGAIDRLAQFFINPLMLQSAVERELKSIESEFMLNKNSDSTRREQLLCSCSDPKHPFAKFSWGNIKSLKDIPEKLGIDPMKELWKFYNKHYYAENMRLVIQGAYTLDELQDGIVKYFSDVPAHPRDGQSLVGEQLQMMQNVGFPFQPCTLGTITRIIPVKDRHSIKITWQIPNQFKYWKSKPTDFVAHLLGHEASGSILSYVRKMSWATSCMAGCGQEGNENATSHAYFSISFSLSLAGLDHWRELVEAIYQYIGMLRQQCRDGWPEWIYDELRKVHEVSYLFGNEATPDQTVEHLVENMAPHVPLPTERLLDGFALLFEFDADAVQLLLDEYLTPDKARIDFMSSSFGKTSDYPNGCHDDGTDTIITDLKILPESDDGSFDVATAGDPQVDPMFGTQFWCRKLSSAFLEKLNIAYQPGKPNIETLHLPPRNPFVPQNFQLKPLPDNDADHPLLNASLKLCIMVGKKKQWFPATVVQFNRKDNSVLLSFEDEDEKWYTLDHHYHEFMQEEFLNDDEFEGTMNQKKIKYRVVALSLIPGAKGAGVRMFGDESDFDVQDGTVFPPIPPPSAHLPIQISTSNTLKMWWLQDRTFKRPIAEFRMQIICAKANSSPLYHAVADLCRSLCADALIETSYLAEMCELACTIESTDTGFYIRAHGFDDKLLDLFQTTLKMLLSFRGITDSLPEGIKQGRFEACVETLQRQYKNVGMSASSLSSRIRLRCMRTNIHSANKKLKEINSMTIPLFCETVSSLLENFAIEAFYHGNVDRVSADEARDLVLRLVESFGGKGLPRRKYPPQSMLRIPAVMEPTLVVVPSKDPKEPNTACEIYFQVGKDNLRDRVLMDVLIHMMEEPIYDQIRTKDQFGYDVHCDVRWSYGIIGCIFHVTTNVKSADAVVHRIEKFLNDFRNELEKMSKDDYNEHIVGLAKHKLDMFNSLSEETNCLWTEIRDGRFEWENWRKETICLKTIQKEDVIKAFDTWLRPGQRRNMFAVQVIGTGENETSMGRPILNNLEEDHGDFVDEQINIFHKACKQQTWGKVNSKLF